MGFKPIKLFSTLDCESFFQTEFSKTYTGEEDEKKHFAEFQKSVELIAAHNPKFEAGEVSYKLGINDFSDRLPEERPGGGIVLPELTSGGIRG